MLGKGLMEITDQTYYADEEDELLHDALVGSFPFPPSVKVEIFPSLHLSVSNTHP
jgi:hypothetical protein